MTVVNNESSDIIRMMATTFLPFAKRPIDLYIATLAPKIDELNTWIYNDINNGAYRAGSQDAYEAAYFAYFRALERLNDILMIFAAMTVQ